MNVDVAYYSSIGGRALNEDSVSVLESGNMMLVLVADGLGGHGGGDAASQCAVASIGKSLNSKMPSEDALYDSIADANSRILSMQTDKIQMKPTIAALWLGGKTAYAANVGDTRIYQFRHERIVYQSVDHSVAQMAVLVGALSQEEIRGSRDRNRLVRALGSESTVKPDISELTVQHGDCFLLCSDGFWELVTEKQMTAKLASCKNVTDWLNAMRRVVDEHKKNNMDNNTAAVLKIM